MKTSPENNYTPTVATRRPILPRLAAALLALAAGSAAFADTTALYTGLDGPKDWANPATWNNGLPGPGNDAYIKTEIIIYSGTTVYDVDYIDIDHRLTIESGGALAGGYVNIEGGGTGEVIIRSGATFNPTDLRLERSVLNLGTGVTIRGSGTFTWGSNDYSTTIIIDGSGAANGTVFFSYGQAKLLNEWYGDEMASLWLDNFADGVFTLIHAGSYSGFTQTDLDKIPLRGTSAQYASVSFDETRGLLLTISGSGSTAVPEPAGYAALAGLALLAWVALRRYRGARG
ncbi:MAG: hypothetical protein LBK99_26260 [Opitutaceae bacterium]|jgi:hypothetical protein|nr:hypothetical protein [Opitutaceae bacterium]